MSSSGSPPNGKLNPPSTGSRLSFGHIRANRILEALGIAARLARRAGLGSAFSLLRDAVDSPFVRLGSPPLRASFGDFALRGFLRHRSYLVDAARPGRTFRDLFVGALRPGTTVVDGGAHVGLYTVLASRSVGPTGRVLAFEPDPYNFAALEHNTRSVGTGNVELHSKAIAEAPQWASFHLSSGTIGSSLRRRGDTAAVQDVEVTSIDAELSGLEVQALVIKLNIESAEPRALDGMRETLARIANVTMFVEVDPSGLREIGVEPEELVAQIERLGFQVFVIRLHDQSLVRADGSTPLVKGHIYCAR
jgi:FkbM family methyltransferase